MRVKFINGFTGTEMYVDESRVDEYRKAGHKPAPKKSGKAPKQEAPPSDEQKE